MTLTPAELTQLAAEDDAYDARCAWLEQMAEVALVNAQIAHAERFAAEQRAGIARADALLAKMDRTLETRT